MKTAHDKKNLRTLGIAALIVVVGSLAVASPIIAQQEGVRKLIKCGINIECYSQGYMITDGFGNVIEFSELYDKDGNLVGRDLNALGKFPTFDQYSSVAEKIGGKKISDTGEKRVYQFPSGGTIIVTNIKTDPVLYKRNIISNGNTIVKETDTEIHYRDSFDKTIIVPKSDIGNWTFDGGLYFAEYEMFMKGVFGDQLYEIMYDTDPDGERMYRYENAKKAADKLESMQYDQLKTDEERGEFFKTMTKAVLHLPNGISFEGTEARPLTEEEKEFMSIRIYPYKGKKYSFKAKYKQGPDIPYIEYNPTQVFDEAGNFLAEFIE